jgi:dTDP-4-amino-4,6-dideoxygalactose transaminase
MTNDLTEIPFNRAFIAGKELYYIAQAVMVNGQLSAGGPFTKRCQEWIENRLACQRVFITHSC